MKKKTKWLAAAIGAVVIAGTSAATVALAHPRSSAGTGPACRGPGMGQGGGHGADMMGIHFLFAHRDSIARTVTEIPGGVQGSCRGDARRLAADSGRKI